MNPQAAIPAAKESPEGSRIFWKRKRPLYKRLLPYLYLLPILAFAAAFTYQPFTRVILQSLHRVNRGGELLAFVGGDNFGRLFSGGAFWNAFVITMKLVTLYVPISLILSLALAMLCTRRRKFSSVYELAFLLPMAISMSALSMIFKLLLNPTSGIVNQLLSVRWGWFLDKQFAIYGILLVCIWMGLSFDFLVFLAAMRNIPPSVIEAATIDGAGPITKFVHIYLPMLSPMIFYIVCTNIIQSIMTSGPVMIITEGGPARSTTTLIYMMYTSGFQSSDYSTAACISIIVFVLTLLFTLLSFSFEKKGVHYQ